MYFGAKIAPQSTSIIFAYLIGNGKNYEPGKRRKIMDISIDNQLLGTNWCISCYPEKIYAQFIWQGHSLCEECFKIYLPKRQELGWEK